MAYRDRLAQSRAQRGQTIELSTVAQDVPSVTPANPTDDFSSLPAFLAEDTSIQDGIQRIKDNVAQISVLRTQSLNAISDADQAELERVDSLTTATRDLVQGLKGRIQRLQAAPAVQDMQLRRNRISLLRSKFLEVTQDYQREEQENRVKSRQRIARQLKIVKPDATAEEVAQAVGGGGQKIFSDALTSTTRYGESRAAYNEVQARQQDLLKVEQTLAELTQLFADMGAFVEQQDVVISTVEDTAKAVNQDTEQALQNTVVAVEHARSYRKGRWICFIIFLVVICVLALVLGLVFGTKK